MEEALKYWPVVASVLGLGLAAAAWAIRKGLASREELEAEAKARAAEDAALGDRLAQVEAVLPHMPDKESVHRLELAMSDLRGEMRALVERMGAVSAVSARLHDWLMEQAK